MGRSKLKHSQLQKQSAYQQNVNKDLTNLNEIELIEAFVSSGADLNAQNLDGETALHLAVRYGLMDICERLIKHGADLSSYDNYGRNALHTACGSNQYDIVRMILEHCSMQLQGAQQNVDIDK